MKDFDLKSVKLGHGAHSVREHGTCLMEAVAWMAGEWHTDQPKCVDPVLGQYGRTLNDNLNDVERQELVPLIPKLLNTSGNVKMSVKRMYTLVDHAIRVALPKVLRDQGLDWQPEMLETLPRIHDAETARRSFHVVSKLSDECPVGGLLFEYAKQSLHTAESAAIAAGYQNDQSYVTALATQAAGYAVHVSTRARNAMQAFQCAVGQIDE